MLGVSHRGAGSQQGGDGAVLWGASSLKMNIMSVERRQEEDGEGRPRGSALPGVEARVEDRSGEHGGVPWRSVFF